MRYDNIPLLSNWKGDSFSIQSDPIVKEINLILENYHKQISPMSKRNLYIDLVRVCKEWESTKPKNYAMEALINVVKRHRPPVTVYPTVNHLYKKAICMGYSKKTGGFDAADRVKYQGDLDDETDMKKRVRIMKAAINQAAGMLPKAYENSDILKIFMAPEFYFRGRYGAYPPEIVSQIMPLLYQGNDGTGRKIFKDWLFVFGTAISATIDARYWCFDCNSNDHIVFGRNPANRNKTIPKCSKGVGHDVQEGIFGAVIDNVALIQKGREKYLVAKEYISGIDFRDPDPKGRSVKNAYVKMKDTGGRSSFSPIPTEGSRDKGSRFRSKFTDERLGGGVFNIDGITFGIEICLDHLVKKLNESRNIQILLIPSAGMNPSYYPTIHKGIIFNVDGLRSVGMSLVEVRNKKSKGDPQKCTVSKPVKVGGDLEGKIERFGPMDIPYL